MRGYSIGVGVALAVLAACGSSPKGQQQAGKLNSAVAKLGETFGDTESNLRVTMEAFENLLGAEGDLGEPFRNFESSLKKGEKLHADLQSRLIDANAAAASWFESYEAGLADIADEGVREQSRQQLEAVRAAYSDLQKKAEAALDGYKPLVEKLRAHAQALSLQLTPASVNAVKAQSGEARTMAQEWYKRHQEIDSTVDRFLKENAPAVAAEES